MKKKVIWIILEIVIMLAVFSCGNKSNVETSEKNSLTISEEEMLTTAVEIDDWCQAVKENKLRAEEKYVGNYYFITGDILDIESDYIMLSTDSYNCTCIIYLPKEDIINLSSAQRVKVVGQIDSIVENTTIENTGKYSIVMNNAYFITDTFELSGTLAMYYKKLYTNGKIVDRTGDKEAWVVGLDMKDDNVNFVYYHMEDEISVDYVAGKNISSVIIGDKEVKKGESITVSAKVFHNNLNGADDYILKDMELVSVNK